MWLKKCVLSAEFALDQENNHIRKSVTPRVRKIVTTPFQNFYTSSWCKQGPNVTKAKHRILVKDLISSNFLNASDKKQAVKE